jgi:hypothetical protein
MDEKQNPQSPSALITTMIANDKSEKNKKRKKANSSEMSDDSDGESVCASAVTTHNRFFVIEAVEGGSLAKYSPSQFKSFCSVALGM